jgi:putative transcriptional regulator
LSQVEPSAHPSDELLSAYASGWIAWPAQLCVCIHLEGCEDCRRAVRAREADDAQFIEALPNAPMAPEALSALVAKLQATEPEPPPPVRRIGDVPLPAALARVKATSRRWLGPGYWVAHFPQASRDGWQAYLLRAPERARISEHSHSGPELVCVLSGELVENRPYRAGDFFEMAGGSHHEIVVGDGPCACFIANNGPLRFSGMAKLAKKLLDL